VLKRLVLAAGVIVLAAAAWAYSSPAALPAGTVADRVVVNKAERRLTLYFREQPLRTYRVALGSHPVGPKQQEGDGRTPEGSYVLDYRNSKSAFHLSLHVSYPSTADSARARERGVKPGGLIMVHGLPNRLGFLGSLHTLNDWTDGCVAVTNTEIEEIWRVVPDGTSILINP
jgi:murein L,D-transpeptidase YafK